MSAATNAFLKIMKFDSLGKDWTLSGTKKKHMQYTIVSTPTPIFITTNVTDSC